MKIIKNNALASAVTTMQIPVFEGVEENNPDKIVLKTTLKAGRRVTV